MFIEGKSIFSMHALVSKPVIDKYALLHAHSQGHLAYT